MKAGGEAPLPWPKLEIGLSAEQPYLSVDSPKPIFRTYCKVCIVDRSTQIANVRIPQLWSAILVGA
jgi:hypothetical protein